MIGGQSSQIIKMAQETDVLLGSAFTATRLIKFCSYKIIVVHEIKTARLCDKNSLDNSLLQNIHGGIVVPHLLFTGPVQA
jgi:hypothetical protein